MNTSALAAVLAAASNDSGVLPTPVARTRPESVEFQNAQQVKAAVKRHKRRVKRASGRD